MSALTPMIKGHQKLQSVLETAVERRQPASSIAIFACGQQYQDAIDLCHTYKLEYLAYDREQIRNGLKLTDSSPNVTLFEMELYSGDPQTFVGYLLHMYTDIVFCYLAHEAPQKQLDSLILPQHLHEIKKPPLEPMQTSVYMIPF